MMVFFMVKFMKCFQLNLLVLVFIFSSSSAAFSKSTNKFNQLVLAKNDLESNFGVRSVECFPFKENIGFTEDQIPLVKQCLTGVNLFKSALDQVPNAEIYSVGISTRFLWTGGFNTVLIPWNASLSETVSFLQGKISKKKQDSFISKVSKLKGKIKKNFNIFSLYCSQRISNEQCVAGYETLAAIKKGPEVKPMRWQEIILDDRQGLGKDSHSYRIKYDSTQKLVLKILQLDPQKVWFPRKKMYEAIDLKFKKSFKKTLQIATYFCSSDLIEKNCIEGMTALNEVSKKQNMRMKAWGEVVIEKYNTFIKDDFDVSIRFDLPADKLVKYFSSKANKVEATENFVIAEKLEKRTLNNSSGLRAVCDLEGMRSKLCSKAFNNFISFISENRGYRVKNPWTNIMFIDGTQLERVNFALNSSARHSYIYIDAASEPEDLEAHLIVFKK
jgi:hypothetical protein